MFEFYDLYFKLFQLQHQHHDLLTAKTYKKERRNKKSGILLQYVLWHKRCGHSYQI